MSSKAAYLVQDKRLVVIKNADLARISKLQHVDILNVNDVLYRQRDLDAVAVVVRPEDDALYRLDPLLGTRRAICAEVVCAVVGRDGEVDALLVLVRDVD